MSDVRRDGLRVVPLGGLGDIGRNLMVYETDDDMVVVDAGLMFPSEEMHGVDYIIPDVSYLEERRHKLRAWLITHGHEDHIGGLRFLLPRLPAPVYAARLPHGLLRLKLEEAGVLDVDQVTIEAGSKLNFGEISAEFFPVAHSIPDAFGIALRTPAGLVVHTGDFKIDHTPVMGAPTDLNALARYGEEGVRLLCSDSTYADRPGHTISELVVGDALEQILLTAPGRVIIATFASQIARVQQIIDGAEEAGRTVFPTGRSMEKNIGMAMELDYIRANERRIRSIGEHRHVSDENSVIVCTGAQGEPMSALSRMASGDHRDVTLKPGDTVVLSSTPIPGNEAAVNTTIDNLFRRGVDVMYSGGGHEHVHVRGHAGQEELKTVIGLTRPQAFVPIHGEYRHLTMHARLAMAMGVPEQNCHIMLDGDALELTANQSEVVDRVPASYVYVDGVNVGGVDHTVLRDRQKLAQDGVVVVVVPVDHQTGQLAGEIELVAKGFVELERSPELRDGAIKKVKELLKRDSHPVEWSQLENGLKRQISTYFYRESRQRPMVIPVAVEV